MSSAAVETAVRARLASQWDATAAAIREPNTDFDPQGRPWIEVRFPGAAIDRADIGDPGNALWEEVGAFMVDIYVPAGSGTAIATTLADAVAAIYQGQEFDFVVCHGRMPGQSGERQPAGIDGVWWGVSFGIAYRYQSITA